MLELNPISAETLNEKAYFELRNAIMTARLLPGESVSLRRLAKALGTSPQPIRDAVRRLVSEKALEALPNRTLRVPELARERFEELWQMRVLLEGEAAALAAKKITEKDLELLRHVNDRMNAAAADNDLPTVFEYNQKFHFMVYQAAGNEILLSLIENLWLLAGPYMTIPLQHYSRADQRPKQITTTHHDELLDALHSRSSSLARKAIKADISAIAKRVLEIKKLQPKAS